VLWGYGGFALVLAMLLRDGSRLDAVPRIYARWLMWFTCWVPLAWAINYFVGERIPKVGASDVSLLSFKPGDAAVHLAGVAAFLFVRPSGWQVRMGPLVIPNGVIWVVWLVGAMIVAAGNRGGMLAIIAALLTVAAFRPRGSGTTLLRLGTAVVVFGGLLVLAGNPTFVDVTNTDGERQISVQQLVDNILSLTGGGSQTGLIGTREWRLLWWRRILDYTVFGDYFWTGKGFGINLADADGFQLDDEGALRSPHNGHLTVLARAGVPGIVLWTLFIVTLGLALARRAARVRGAGDGTSARLALWLIAYLVAFLVNAAFDVYLEGPQGGIWFWSVAGLALALVGTAEPPPASPSGRAARAAPAARVTGLSA
jgi:hypothetical protein